MEDAVGMQILNPREQLLKILDCLFLVQSSLLHDMVKQFSALRVLHDEVDAVLSLDDLGRMGGTS